MKFFQKIQVMINIITQSEVVERSLDEGEKGKPMKGSTLESENLVIRRSQSSPCRGKGTRKDSELGMSLACLRSLKKIGTFAQ